MAGPGTKAGEGSGPRPGQGAFGASGAFRGLPGRLWTVCLDSLRGWVRHRAASRGAALSFYTLFSLAPILVLVIAIAGYVFGARAAQGEIFAQLQGLMGATGALAIQDLLAETHLGGSGTAATVTAAALLFLGATSVFAELKDSLDELWDLTPKAPTGLLGFLRARLLSFGLVLVLAFLLLVSLVVNALLAFLSRQWAGAWLQTYGIASTLNSLFTYAVIASLFAVIYKMLPESGLSWRDVSIGALCTAGLFLVGKSAIGLYLGNSRIGSGFGAAGSLMALLVWVYYSAQIFFLGAEFTRAFARHFGSLRDGRD